MVHIRATQVHHPLFHEAHGLAFSVTDTLEWVVEERTQKWALAFQSRR